MKESLDYRIQETARQEIGIDVSYDNSHYITREGIINYECPWMPNQLVRSHNISMLFFCQLPKGYHIENNSDREPSPGDQKWFEKMLNKLLLAHQYLYGDIIENYSLCCKDVLI